MDYFTLVYSIIAFIGIVVGLVVTLYIDTKKLVKFSDAFFENLSTQTSTQTSTQASTQASTFEEIKKMFPILENSKLITSGLLDVQELGIPEVQILVILPSNVWLVDKFKYNGINYLESIHEYKFRIEYKLIINGRAVRVFKIETEQLNVVKNVVKNVEIVLHYKSYANDGKSMKYMQTDVKLADLTLIKLLDILLEDAHD